MLRSVSVDNKNSSLYRFDFSAKHNYFLVYVVADALAHSKVNLFQSLLLHIPWTYKLDPLVNYWDRPI